MRDIDPRLGCGKAPVRDSRGPPRTSHRRCRLDQRPLQEMVAAVTHGRHRAGCTGREDGREAARPGCSQKRRRVSFPRTQGKKKATVARLVEIWVRGIRPRANEKSKILMSRASWMAMRGGLVRMMRHSFLLGWPRRVLLRVYEPAQSRRRRGPLGGIRDSLPAIASGEDGTDLQMQTFVHAGWWFSALWSVSRKAEVTSAAHHTHARCGLVEQGWPIFCSCQAALRPVEGGRGQTGWCRTRGR